MLCNWASADIEYTWTIPTQHTDNTAMQVSEISHYVIEYTVPGPAATPTTVKTALGTDTRLIVLGVTSATAKIATVTKDGQQGPWSDPVSCAPPATKMSLRCEIVQ